MIQKKTCIIIHKGRNFHTGSVLKLKLTSIFHSIKEYLHTNLEYEINYDQDIINSFLQRYFIVYQPILQMRPEIYNYGNKNDKVMN